MNIRQTASALVLILAIVALLGLSQDRQKAQHTISSARAAEAESLLPLDVPTDLPPDIYQGSFFYTSTDEMLRALGVFVQPSDKVIAFPPPELGVGSTIYVYHPQHILLKDRGTDRLLPTWAKTVKGFLDAEKIELLPEDSVQPAPEALIPTADSPFVVTITRTLHNEESATSAIPYTTEYKDDPNLDKGTKKVEQVGKNGVLKKTFAVVVENGVEISRKEAKKETIQEPVKEIIRRGTKVPPPPPPPAGGVLVGTGGASWYGGVPALTAAHKTLPFGTMVKVTNLENGKTVVVRINDRGPFIAGRIIDLSSDSFAQIASLGTGVVNVKVEKL